MTISEDAVETILIHYSHETSSAKAKRIVAALTAHEANSVSKESSPPEPDALAVIEAARHLFGANKNELVSRGLPLEWSPNSGMGVMERALAAYDKAKRPAQDHAHVEK